MWTQNGKWGNMGEALVYDTNDLALVPALSCATFPMPVSPSKLNGSIETNLLLNEAWWTLLYHCGHMRDNARVELNVYLV